MKKQIKITGIIGIIAALLMFTGDMFLYFTTEPITNMDEDIFRIMAQIPHTRIMIGGILGPIAAFLYVFGFYHICLAIKPAYKKIARIIFILLCFGIFSGGVFHSHFTYFGLIASFNNPALLKLAQEYTFLVFYIMFIPSLIAYSLIAYLILTNKTYYPKWMALLSPIVLIWFNDLMRLLPQPFKIVMSGGWYNIIFIIFFSVSMVILSKKIKDESWSRFI